LIEAQALAALCHHSLHQPTEALEALAGALRLAEPEGYVRVFLNEGLPMLALLRQAAGRSIRPGYVAALLRAAGASAQVLSAPSPAATPDERPAPLVELLSERELEVLRLMAGYLSNAQIAECLTVSVGTVKTHIHHIYGKLGVAGRAEAIERSRQLRLI
jgi:LuxR family maltose regulon positive regulatory protein